MRNFAIAFVLFDALLYAGGAHAEPEPQSSPSPTGLPSAPLADTAGGGPEPAPQPSSVPVPSAPELPMLQGGTVAARGCVQPPDAYNHDGFYLRIGLGAGYAAFSGEGPSGHSSVTDSAFGLFLGLGGTILPGLVLGAALTSATTNRSTLKGAPAQGPTQVDATQIVLGFLLDWYPNPTGGWHAGALLGLGGPTLSNDSIDWSGAVVAGSVFGGYDWWIGPQWSLGASLAVSVTPSTTLEDSGRDTGLQLGSSSIMVIGAFVLH